MRKAGHAELADKIDDVLVGREVGRDIWTYQIVEAYDEQYWQVSGPSMRSFAFGCRTARRTCSRQS